MVILIAGKEDEPRRVKLIHPTTSQKLRAVSSAAQNGPLPDSFEHVARGRRVDVTCSRCCCSFDSKAAVHNSTIVQRAWAAIMENCPPYNLARRSSLMHSRHPSKSSPAKRDTTRVLTPQQNNAVVPSDAFNTGLLTPQASQNTFDSDAATSLISPPPEDSERVGINCQSVRVALPVFCPR